MFHANQPATRLLGCAWLGVIVFAAGCGSEFPATAPVSGIVTYKGTPVEGANVVFSRGTRNVAQGEIAVGKTDASGRFELTTHFGSKASAKGAVPGDYEVTVSKHIPPKGMSQAQYQALVEAADKVSAVGGTLPAHQQPPPMVEMFSPQYSVTGKTQLKTSVPSAGVEDLSFSLK